jgi:hypothetical protein
MAKEKSSAELQLEDVFKDRTQLLNFHEFLRANYCDENLAFWLEAGNSFLDQTPNASFLNNIYHYSC